jgi:Big-like domain-containing protein
MRVRSLPALLCLPLLLAACEKPARVDVEPSSLRFGLRGQTAALHATPRLRDGKPVPKESCRWSSSDEKVATVTGPANDATVTATGPGNATVRCTIGDAKSEVPVMVRVVSRIAVKPASVEVRMEDEPRPVALQVEAFDDAGAPVLGRVAYTRCADEGVCRGDGRGQLWGVSAGSSTAIVEVEGARAEIPVKVVDARTAEGKPKRVTGNPMDAIEKEVRQREAEEAKKKGK